MNNNILKVAKREYIRIVKKKSFWLTILALPILYFVLGTIVGESAEEAERKVAEEAAKAQKIIIVDQAEVINDQLVTGALVRSDNFDTAKNEVRDGTADVAIIYPITISENNSIEIYAQRTNLISGSRFNDLATSLIKQSILLDLGDPEKIALFNTEFKVDQTLYEDGKESSDSLENYIVPLVAVLLYFMLMILSGNFMLSSVAEEKENRVAETLLSIMPPKQLIWGKIIGLTGVAITQVLALIVFGAIAVLISSSALVAFDIDWSAVEISFWPTINALFYILTGFIFMASVMVGVGAAMPTQREAQQFSGIFIMLTVFPMYLAPLILTDPSGLLARVISFFPFTAPLILLFRSTIGELVLWESILGIIAMLIYVAIGLYVAFKLFEIGSMELSNRISLRSLFQRGKK
ncbi:ABC transporter permease [Patescibacteria group bacterium]